jgi:hypothetical protein
VAKQASTSSKTIRSYRDLDPVEQGGRIARDGFEYQDHIAAGKCLEMLLDNGVSEVWCEAEDDIVLVWTVGDDEQFDFVQVKGEDLGRAWTVAKLCERDLSKTGPRTGTSIPERSLAHDRGLEKCHFRVITRWKPDSLLSALVDEIGSPARQSKTSEIAQLVNSLRAKLGQQQSPNGNDLSFWCQRTVWEFKATVQDVKNDNLIKLEKILEKQGQLLDSNNRQRLYDRLYLHVQDASLACGRTQKQTKRLQRERLLAWLAAETNHLLTPACVGTSAALERKMCAAFIPSVSVETAKDQRRRYLQEIRHPKYLSIDRRDAAEAEGLARLHRLKIQLDAGELSDNGLQFLSRSQQTLLDYRNSMDGEPKPPDWFIFGFLYEVMNRCKHDLVQVTI